MTMIIDGTNGLTFNDSSTQTKGGLTGSTSQLCKAWVNYNGSTQTINASYNVSSVTYTATGRYVVNFTTPFSSTNYTMSGSGTDSINQMIISVYSGGTVTVSACPISATDTAGFGNNARISAVFFGT